MRFGAWTHPHPILISHAATPYGFQQMSDALGDEDLIRWCLYPKSETCLMHYQVIVGSFIADGKKSKSGPLSAPMSNMLNFSEPVAAESPPSQGHSSESSDENGGSPFNRVSGPYNNASQPVHNTMPMYSNMGWGNSMWRWFPVHGTLLLFRWPA